jgi:hypothetical protein
MMATDIEALRSARNQAREAWETLDAKARSIRATLTQAEREARTALRKFERARLAYVEAMDQAEESMR